MRPIVSRSLASLCSALAALACLPGAAQEPAAGPEGEATAAQPPAAYTLSFRVIKVDVAEGLDRREFVDLPDGVFLRAPRDGDGFYDRAFLRNMYGEAIRPGLVAAVGPVYSMTVAPRAEPVTIKNVLKDGKTEWSFSAFLEPLSEDGLRVDLRANWYTKDLLFFESSPDTEPGRCELFVG